MVTPCTWGRVDTLFRDACLLGWAGLAGGRVHSPLSSLVKPQPGTFLSSPTRQ